jgi:hypothetical protein
LPQGSSWFAFFFSVSMTRLQTDSMISLDSSWTRLSWSSIDNDADSTYHLAAVPLAHTRDNGLGDPFSRPDSMHSISSYKFIGPLRDAENCPPPLPLPAVSISNPPKLKTSHSREKNIKLQASLGVGFPPPRKTMR